MLLGFDIGGTKCAVITAEFDGKNVRFLGKEKFSTDFTITPEQMIDRLICAADKLVGDGWVEAIGISCGGPLDSKRGVILSPPNLPNWNEVYIAEQIKKHFNVPVKLQNDANACAYAEWKFGAGKDCENMVFLTFGTGLGAGLVLNGKLYDGASGNAGEVGHIRLADSGPIGYGKEGSFEGFCSGNGLAQLGYFIALEEIEKGNQPLYYKKGMDKGEITAKTIAQAAELGDKAALKVFSVCGEYLGRGLAVIIDILNPEKIVIGSIFARAQKFLLPKTKEFIEKEALDCAGRVCQVVPAGLGEQIGDYAAIATALI